MVPIRAQVPPCSKPAREKGCGVPPPNVNVPPAKVELPVFLTVRVSGLLVVLIAMLPKASVLGDTVAVPGLTPVPLSATGEPVTVAFAVMVIVPE